MATDPTTYASAEPYAAERGTAPVEPPLGIGEIFRQEQQTLVNYATQITGSTDDAQDVVSDAFGKLLVEIESGTKIRSPRAWLNTCVRNGALSVVRGRTRRPQITFDEDAGQPDLELAGTRGSVVDAAHFRQCSRTVMNALEDMPSRQRAAFVLAELRGLDRAEMAAELGVNSNAARQLLHRARRHLQRNLGPDTLGAPLPAHVVFSWLRCKADEVASTARERIGFLWARWRAVTRLPQDLAGGLATGAVALVVGSVAISALTMGVGAGIAAVGGDLSVGAFVRNHSGCIESADERPGRSLAPGTAGGNDGNDAAPNGSSPSRESGGNGDDRRAGAAAPLAGQAGNPVDGALLRGGDTSPHAGSDDRWSIVWTDYWIWSANHSVVWLPYELVYVGRSTDIVYIPRDTRAGHAPTVAERHDLRESARGHVRAANGFAKAPRVTDMKRGGGHRQDSPLARTRTTAPARVSVRPSVSGARPQGRPSHQTAKPLGRESANGRRPDSRGKEPGKPTQARPVANEQPSPSQTPAPPAHRPPDSQAGEGRTPDGPSLAPPQPGPAMSGLNRPRK